MDIISKRYIFLISGAILVLTSWVLVAFLGLRQGIDLKGGTRWQIAFQDSNITEANIKQILHESSGVEPAVTRADDQSFIIRLPETDETKHAEYLSALRKLGELEEKNFSNIGPAIGSELRQKALWAIVVVLFSISIYIAWAFRKVSRPIGSWKYGVVTLITLIHDVSIPSGLLAVLGRLKGIEIDTNFIVALLVVMGFSVHDTIVVFDRIRENLISSRGRNIPLAEIINKSIKETFVRSINTTLTLVFVLLALVFVGPPSLFYFIITILVGTVFGTYSSIFIASPLLYIWAKKSTF